MVSVVQKPQEAFQGSQVGCKSRRARGQPGRADSRVAQGSVSGPGPLRDLVLARGLVGGAAGGCSQLLYDRRGACLEPRGTKSHLLPPHYLDNSQDAGLAGRVSMGQAEAGTCTLVV